MQRRILAIVLAVMLLSVGIVSAETTPAQSYWEQLKTIYEEWTAIDGETTLEITFNLPDEDSKTFHVHITSVSDMDAFVTHNVFEVTSDDLDLDIPTIEMYTQGANIYLNTEVVMFFAKLAGMGDMVLEEAFVKLENTETEFNLDANFLMQVLEFVEGMEIGFDLNMTLEDGIYELTLTSDEMIDLLNAYIMYVMTNMDALAEITGQTAAMEISEEEMEEALAAYTQMILPMLEEVKKAIEGSYYTATTVFKEDTYTEDGQLVLLSPFFNLTLTTESTANKLESADITLPASVKVFTEEDLTNLLMASMSGPGTTAQQVVFAVDETSYFADGEMKTMDVSPFISADGHLMVPVRYLEDLYGMTPAWDAASKTVTIVYNDAVYQMTIDSNVVVIDGVTEIKMDATAVIVDGRTFVPVSRFAAAMGIEYEWDENSQTVFFY